MKKTKQNKTKQTEQVMLIDKNYFHKVNLNELNSWKIHIFEEITYKKQKFCISSGFALSNKTTNSKNQRLDLLLKISKSHQGGKS